MFAFNIFGGSPTRFVVASLGQCLASVKFQGPSPPRGRDIVCWNSRFGWVQTHMPSFLDSGPKCWRDVL